MNPDRRRTLVALAALAVTPLAGCGEAAAQTVDLYKNRACGCCGAWAKHMEDAGFRVIAHDMDDVTPVKRRHGLPHGLGSCHTAIVAGFVIEGHVPADLVRRLIAEHPPGVIGLAVPGMPQGSPGMESPAPESYDVIAFDARGGTRVYARR